MHLCALGRGKHRTAVRSAGTVLALPGATAAAAVPCGGVAPPLAGLCTAPPALQCLLRCAFFLWKRPAVLFLQRASSHSCALARPGAPLCKRWPPRCSGTLPWALACLAYRVSACWAGILFPGRTAISLARPRFSPGSHLLSRRCWRWPLHGSLPGLQEHRKAAGLHSWNWPCNCSHRHFRLALGQPDTNWHADCWCQAAHGSAVV